MNSGDSVLALRFIEGDETLAVLEIAAVSEPKSEAIDQTEQLPAYIDSSSIVNVPNIRDEAEIDESSPIMLYSGTDPDIRTLLLLEETDYELRLTGEVDEAFGYLRSNSSDVALREMHFRGERGDALYRLTFKSYVGKGYFDVRSHGRTIKIPFEVRSKKIGYLSEYPRMLGDISEFSTSLLLHTKSPLYSEFQMSCNDRDTLYEDFLILDYIFSKLDLVGVYEYLRNNLHHELVQIQESVPAGVASSIDPSDLISLIDPGNLIKTENGPICGTYVPAYVIENLYTDDYDVPENRLVKTFLLTVQRMVHRLLIKGSAESSYISDRLMFMRSAIDGMMSDSWLNEVGQMTSIPFNSTILQRKSGYSEIFTMFQIVGLGITFRQEDAKELLKGQNNRVYQVYEYWCYTRLYRCLRSMSSNKPEFPLKRIDGRWAVSISRGHQLVFEMRYGETILNVVLLYNRTYDRYHQDFRSYSVPFRPDFTLIITSSVVPERRFIVNFDAKYKAKPKSDSDIVQDDSKIDSDSWEYDIYKMHAYRDAIIHCCGSFVLYPGHRGRIYSKSMNDKDWNNRSSLIIPSVGAIPLIPGSKKDDDLEIWLSKIFNEISSIKTGEEILENI